MSLSLTLWLLAPALAMLGLAAWQVRRKREPTGNPSLIDWHYVLFPAIVMTGLLLLHLFMLLTGK